MQLLAPGFLPLLGQPDSRRLWSIPDVGPELHFVLRADEAAGKRCSGIRAQSGRLYDPKTRGRVQLRGLHTTMGPSD